ncbi:MAG TPA: toll/interleukin-1 receptor domain-containing protein [Ktedonobacterales bacterium]|nr:toll/interleukin-1 receptor domain-containing protein [Ktedonobacterales bacterium]
MQSAPSRQPRVFLSYSATDEVLARQLQVDLEAAGATIYQAPASLGGNAGEVARNTIERCDWVVVILSPAAIASQWVQTEIALAAEYANRQSLRGALLFAVQPYDPAMLPPAWATLERIDAMRNMTTGLMELLARLGLRAAETGTDTAPVTGWVGGLGYAEPDIADRASAEKAKPEEPAAAPTPETEEEPAAAPASAVDADAVDEIVRGITFGGDDTPTMEAPREEQTPTTEAAPPPPAAPGGAASDWTDDTRVRGIVYPPAPPSPAPSPAPPPPAPPAAQPPAPPAPGGFPPPDGAPAPGFGAPPPAPPMYPQQPAYPPAQGGPSYVPQGQPPSGYPSAPAPSYPPYPPAPGYAPPPAYGAPPNPMAPAPQGGYGYPGPFASWPQAPVAVAEQVTFTAYHVREIAPQAWQPLYVYIALDTPQAQAQVQAAAQQALAGRMGEFRPAVAAETAWLRRGTQLTFVPGVPGCVFDPPELTVPWQADAQQLAFRMQATTARPGFAVNGSIQVFTGPLLRADIPISIFVRQPGMYPQTPQPQSFASSTARAYRKVFASYSHRDTSVVQSCETAAQATGDRYLRDVSLLRSGEQWNDRLLQAIGEADLFQLFWSQNAAHSPAVQTEWRHALALQPARGIFIRPVYWSRQVYSIPPELQSIHFERISLARLGWGKARIFLHDMLGLG